MFYLLVNCFKIQNVLKEIIVFLSNKKKKKYRKLDRLYD